MYLYIGSGSLSMPELENALDERKDKDKGGTSTCTDVPVLAA